MSTRITCEFDLEFTGVTNYREKVDKGVVIVPGAESSRTETYNAIRTTFPDSEAASLILAPCTVGCRVVISAKSTETVSVTLGSGEPVIVSFTGDLEDTCEKIMSRLAEVFYSDPSRYTPEEVDAAFYLVGEFLPSLIEITMERLNEPEE